jgi:hypothetical protein
LKSLESRDPHGGDKRLGYAAENHDLAMRIVSTRGIRMFLPVSAAVKVMDIIAD